MIQFAIIVVLGLIGIFAFQKLREELKKLDEAERIQKEKKAREEVESNRKKVDTLTKDPVTGVYRLDDDDR
ncbi:MAG: hypothetical protein AAGE61_22395 [Pseudomonadota bacterium]